MGKKNSRISIMIIPHTEKVRRLTVPSWVPKVFFIAIITTIINVSLAFNKIYTSHMSLEEEYKEKISIINKLEEENKNKEVELSKLKSQNKKLYEKTNEVEEKLAEIEKLQREVEKLVGIKSPSRGGGLDDNLSREITEPVAELQVLKEVLEDKEKELIAFIDDVEKQLQYLETVPSLWPAKGKLTSKFGNRKNPFGRGIQFHYGIDIANSTGTDIRAAGSGKIIFSGYKTGYGYTIIIDHGNGYKTYYGHNSKLLVNKGDKVEKGQVIAKMGSTGRSTGPHLHFEIHKSDKPIDPLTVLK
ncbi:peptidoglycan DD-metalloendopeptidase family protein [Tepidimicrobium xylanilyticum]|uniref:Murein DD-endopeptidase MepM and murein hydrolase activator NlpD, contain LysM domain n=1 Tax=Tepidimicrobium xylanilyticum TaxID=1123352 RepID=A0A1H2X5X0_9FIRM|nr:M23 family metallopeptidase [Tepidimicrobium xylanilyticum]GMG97410.1 peptidase M23 [Tepidimicrobium xylanilyticum]SDW88303.1 Murein DD-endopeptidase MepM and murein hydrolase activator NlpD, contain LysM domain [Tepidimicrobium xylanilyticum]